MLLVVCVLQARAQDCPNVPWPNPHPDVCSGTYGDASGSTVWNWEVTPDDPSYCNMWYARLGSNLIVAMKSPFMNPSTSAMEAIATSKDYTKEKGWFLLKRDFGCGGGINYPYFLLYNKWSGLVRLYAYLPSTTTMHNGLMVVVTPTKTLYPAVTALADPLAGSTDKFKNSNNGAYGKSIIAVGEPAGPTSWTVLEFYAGFDPNTGILDYAGCGLEFAIHNVLNFGMEATINGKSVSGGSPALYNYSYVPAVGKTNENGFDKFIADGRKFYKAFKTVEDGAKDIYKSANDLFTKLSNAPTTAEKKIAEGAAGIAKATGDSKQWVKEIGKIASAISIVGTVFNTIGDLMGLFSDSRPSITYSSINMELKGSITANTVGQTFTMRIPGVQDVLPPSNNGTQRPYYDCPLGTFALKTTPTADLITYKRDMALAHYVDMNSPYPYIKFRSEAKNFKSFRLRDNLAVAVNEKAGLELVSAKVAFVGEVLPYASAPAEPAYDALSPHSSNGLNYLLYEFQNNRLEILNYRDDKFYTFRSPFEDIGCAKGMTFNVVAATKVYLRLIAILKRKDDPASTPIFFSKDYALETIDQSLTEAEKYKYTVMGGDADHLPPYTNLTQPPLWTADEDKSLKNAYLTNGDYFACDNDIYTEGWLISPSNAQNVMLNAGGEITLNPGFEASWGTTFTAQINRYGYQLNCTTPLVEHYNPTGNCYSTTAVAQAATFEPENEAKVKATGVSVYPVPSTGTVNIEMKGLPASVITVTDLSGKIVHQQAISNSINKLNLYHLPNGVYFLRIVYPDKTVVKKIQLNK